MTERLSVRDLHVSIPTRAGTVRAVRGVSLDLQRGETLCVVGESGCGKSMLSLAIMDLLPRKAKRTASAISLSGKSLLDLNGRQMASVRGARMAMIFQEPMTSLNPVYSIGDQLTETYLRHNAKASRNMARARALEMLEKVGISGAERRLRQYPHQLSGGQRQRIMVAMALICDPEVLIADEPTTALDVTIQAQILHLLRKLQKENGMAMILITHDLGVVARCADRVAVMYGGAVVESAPVGRLFDAPTHPYTRGLLACLPNPARVRPGDRLGSIPGTVPTLLDDFQGCAFRSRCPLASQVCETSPLTRHELQDGHSYACTAPADTLRDDTRWAAEVQG